MVTLKATSLGTPSAVSAFLAPEGASRTTDSGSYSYHAGPVKRSAPGRCVKWGGPPPEPQPRAGGWIRSHGMPYRSSKTATVPYGSCRGSSRNRTPAATMRACCAGRVTIEPGGRKVAVIRLAPKG